jgi:integrase
VHPRAALACARRAPTERIFGQRWRGWPRHWVTRICKAAGVPVLCVHSMRSLYASLALREERRRMNHAN